MDPATYARIVRRNLEPHMGRALWTMSGRWERFPRNGPAVFYIFAVIITCVVALSVFLANLFLPLYMTLSVLVVDIVMCLILMAPWMVEAVPALGFLKDFKASDSMAIAMVKEVVPAPAFSIARLDDHCYIVTMDGSRVMVGIFDHPKRPDRVIVHIHDGGIRVHPLTKELMAHLDGHLPI